MKLRNLLLPLSLVLSSTSWGLGMGADTVISVEYGANAGYGQSAFPSIVLGVPKGSGGTQGSLDVLSLGIGGSIILGFLDEIVVDGPGPDLIIFENPFFIGGDTNNIYVEAARVEFESDSVEFVPYPFDFIPGIEPIGNPRKFVGFAGVYPVYSCDGVPDPTDPNLAGGDPFDLAVVGLQNANYVRIIDCGSHTYDGDGDLVTDPGDCPPHNLPPQAGFDLDAVVAIHWTEAQNPFRVVKAVATAPETVLITFSKELCQDSIPAPWHFSLNGIPLSDEDWVFLSGATDIILVLNEALEPPLPVLSVSQALRSVEGENLLNRYEKELELGFPTRCRDTSPTSLQEPHFTLHAYPNPSALSVKFRTSFPIETRITIWNLMGELVRTIRVENGEAVWDGCSEFGSRVPVGCYISRLERNGREAAVKVIILH